MASISAVDIQEEGTYAQRHGWMEHGYHKARPIALWRGFDWGRTEALRDWPIGCFYSCANKMRITMVLRQTRAAS